MVQPLWKALASKVNNTLLFDPNIRLLCVYKTEMCTYVQ